MHNVESARTAADLDQILAATRLLVPTRVRDRVLGAIANAHAVGQLDFAEFLARSDRAHAPLSYSDAAGLVGDLGVVIRMPRATRQIRRRHRRTLRLALIGGGVGAGLVALPVAVTFPGEIVSWLPVVACTGTFTAAGTAAVAVVAPLRWRTMAGPAAVDHSPPSGPDGGRDELPPQD